MFYRTAPLANFYDVTAPGHIQQRSERCSKTDIFSIFADFIPVGVGPSMLEASLPMGDSAVWSFISFIFSLVAQYKLCFTLSLISVILHVEMVASESQALSMP
jgi:hypothetical protein